jgi:hypothetical protein
MIRERKGTFEPEGAQVGQSSPSKSRRRRCSWTTTARYYTSPWTALTGRASRS